MRCNQINFISCYLTPNESIGDFQAKLDCLGDASIDMEGELIVSGDFNAKAFAKNAPMEAETMDRIVDALFPTHPKRSENPW